jgi:putative aldouronate transport system substrate-binding protein
MKRIIRLSIAVVLILTVSAGLFATGSSEGGAADTGDQPMPMRYVVPGTAPSELALALDAVNEKLVADGVGIDVAVDYVAWDAWDQKTNLMLSTGEAFELFHVMENRVPTPTYASRGALTPLDDLIDEYAPALGDMFTEDQWAAVTVDGERLSIPAIWRRVVGVGGIDGVIYVRQDLLDRYGLEIPRTLDEFVEVAKALQAGVEADTGETWYMWEHEIYYSSAWIYRALDTYPFYVQHSEEVLLIRDDGTVEPYYRTDEFRQAAEFHRRLYQEGLIHPDILSLPSEARTQTVNQQGKFLFGAGTGGYGDVPNMRRNDPNAELSDFVFNPDQPFYVNLAVLNSNAVPATTDTPEAGLMFLDWLYSSKENHDLFLYGIEGRHYHAEGEDRMEPVLNASDQPLYAHQFWQVAWAPFTRFNVTAPEKQVEQFTQPLPASQKQEGIVLGFGFDSQPVNTEYTNILAARQEVLFPIKWGVVEYDEYFDELDQRMRAAGIDRVVAEYQRQLDEYLASK